MRLLKRLLLAVAIILAVIFIIYLLGPSPAKPLFQTQVPAITSPLDSLDELVANAEAAYQIKPDNEARIVWANDGIKTKTECSIVYLHGFSASQEEGDPVHLTLAKNFGCNLYLSRLADHGIDTAEQLLNFTPDRLWESGKHALAIGKQLGQKVILMGTSTGGTLALKLAAEYPNDVHALMLLSPNIAIHNTNAWLLNNHWGLQIARKVQGSQYIASRDERAIYKNYWSSPYRLEAAVQLQELMENTMTVETFGKISQPLFVAYYYADDSHQDNVVRVDAMLNMLEEVATPAAQKLSVAVPKAGDHVIGSYIKSGDYISVIDGGRKFMQEIMKMRRTNMDTVVSTRSALPLH